MKEYILALLATLAGCTDCNTQMKPLRVLTATKTATNNSWIQWTVLVEQGPNRYTYCRGKTEKDMTIKPGKYYTLQHFYKEDSLGEIRQ